MTNPLTNPQNQEAILQSVKGILETPSNQPEQMRDYILSLLDRMYKYARRVCIDPTSSDPSDHPDLLFTEEGKPVDVQLAVDLSLTELELIILSLGNVPQDHPARKVVGSLVDRMVPMQRAMAERKQAYSLGGEKK